MQRDHTTGKEALQGKCSNAFNCRVVMPPLLMFDQSQQGLSKVNSNYKHPPVAPHSECIASHTRLRHCHKLPTSGAT